MEEEQIKSDVFAIVASQLGKEAQDIKEESRFVEDLGADSLDNVEIIMEMEKKFQITIPDDKAQTITTVGEAVKHIHEHLASKSD